MLLVGPALGGTIVFFFQAEDGIRDSSVTGVQTCALPILPLVAFHLHATTAMAALLFFFFIVVISLWAGFVTSVFACILAVLCFNYFFAPPIFDLRVRDPRDIAIVIAFSSVGLVISRLMSRITNRTAVLKQINEQLR